MDSMDSKKITKIAGLYGEVAMDLYNLAMTLKYEDELAYQRAKEKMVDRAMTRTPEEWLASADLFRRIRRNNMGARDNPVETKYAERILKQHDILLDA